MTTTVSDTREVQGPLVTLVIGLLLWAVVLWTAQLGVGGIVVGLGIIVAAIAIEAAVGLAAAFATAALMSTSFGETKTAYLKIAAVVAAAGAISALVPMGWVFAFFVYLGLLIWFFELEVLEAFVFAVVFTVLRIVVNVILIAALGGI